MDLEIYVANELEQRHYPIFYKNLCISLPNKLLITEFDIVSKDFIIEVKSGNDVCTKCNQIKNQVSLLPKGYKLYYYCPALDNTSIQNYNKNFFSLSNLITYINDLNVIYNNHKPINEVNIKTQRDFTKFLAYSVDRLKIFTKIYITYEVFYYTYVSVTFVNDHYSSADKDRIYSSEKVKYLIENNIIHMVDQFDETIPSFVKNTPINKIFIKDITHINPLKIPLYYSIDWTVIKLYHTDLYKILPIINGITKECEYCKQKIIFTKQVCCELCYLPLKNILPKQLKQSLL